MDKDPQSVPDQHGGSAKFGPMRLLILFLVLLSLWIGRAFLLEIAWAATLAIALWPLYQRLCRQRAGLRAGEARLRIAAPLGFTLATGVVVMLPLVIVAVEAVRDSQAAIDWVTRAQQTGVRAPPWIAHLPLVGGRVQGWWHAHLTDPQGAAALLRDMDAGALARWTGVLAAQLAYGALFLFVTLLALFFMLRDGDQLTDNVYRTARHFYGAFGETFVTRLVGAVRGAVNGTVFVAIGEGAIIGIGYAVAGVPRAVLFTMATIAFAMLPLGAWAAFGVASLVLLAQGHVLAALLLFAFGAVVMLVGDNFVQPYLVGHSVALPFLWTFIATFGGLQTFGLVGLFIGPAVIAMLLLAWREWTGTAPPLAQNNGKGPAGRSHDTMNL
jgi:predicted PurR-regulated permease PerM